MRRRDFLASAVATAAAPQAVVAQPQTMPVIGRLVIGSLDAPQQTALTEGFNRALRNLGYIAGQTVAIEERSAEGRIERLPELARDLVARKVDVIVAGSTPGALAARRATTTIPIIGSAMGDPINDGLAVSLRRPGGNVTGNTFLGPELVPKRLALLKELLPSVARVALLWHPTAFGQQTMTAMMQEAREAAGALDLELQFTPAGNADELARAFAAMAEMHPDAAFQFPSPVFFGAGGRLVELAALHRLPMMFNAREFVELGGLIAYGASIAELTGRTALYVDKILKGAKPADLPIEQPTSFELLINLKTAKALGLTVPQSLLQRADEVIE